MTALFGFARRTRARLFPPLTGAQAEMLARLKFPCC